MDAPSVNFKLPGSYHTADKAKVGLCLDKAPRIRFDRFIRYHMEVFLWHVFLFLSYLFFFSQLGALPHFLFMMVLERHVLV